MLKDWCCFPLLTGCKKTTWVSGGLCPKNRWSFCCSKPSWTENGTVPALLFRWFGGLLALIISVRYVNFNGHHWVQQCVSNELKVFGPKLRQCHETLDMTLTKPSSLTTYCYCCLFICFSWNCFNMFQPGAKPQDRRKWSAESLERTIGYRPISCTIRPMMAIMAKRPRLLSLLSLLSHPRAIPFFPESWICVSHGDNHTVHWLLLLLATVLQGGKDRKNQGQSKRLTLRGYNTSQTFSQTVKVMFLEHLPLTKVTIHQSGQLYRVVDKHETKSFWGVPCQLSFVWTGSDETKN